MEEDFSVTEINILKRETSFPFYLVFLLTTIIIAGVSFYFLFSSYFIPQLKSEDYNCLNGLSNIIYSVIFIPSGLFFCILVSFFGMSIIYHIERAKLINKLLLMAGIPTSGKTGAVLNVRPGKIM